MADFNALEALINAHIKKNGVQAITGNILNGILRGMVAALGKGYTIAGSASPSTDPGTMTGPLAYIAYTAGTYTHFDNIVVEQGEVSMLIYNEAEWHKEVLFSLAAQATVDDNIGVPSVGVSFVDGILTFNFRNMKGEPGENGQDGDPAGFGTISASISGGVGTPGVSVQSSGPDTAKNIAFQFTNLKGETGVTSCVVTVDNTTGNPSCAVSLVGQELHLDFSGLKGAQGNTGSSVDYPFTIVNNLTTDDATQALSAAMGVQLESEVSQLEAKVLDNIFNYTFVDGNYLNTNGEEVSFWNGSCTDFIEAAKGDNFYFTGQTMGAFKNVCGYDASKGFVSALYTGVGDNTKITINNPTIAYVRCCANKNDSGKSFIKMNYNSLGMLSNRIDALGENIKTSVYDEMTSDFVSGYCINHSGQKIAGTLFGYKEFSVLAGAVIVFSGQVNAAFAAIAKKISPTSYKELVAATATAEATFTYTATEDMTIAVSFYPAYSRSIKIDTLLIGSNRTNIVLLQNDLQEHETEQTIKDVGFGYLFNKIAVIGDSMAVATMDGYQPPLGASWLSFLAKRWASAGKQWYAMGGTTAYDWLNDTNYGLGKLLADETIYNCYFIAYGHNDSATVGEATDEAAPVTITDGVPSCPSGYSFCAYYKAIINQIRTKAPHAMIFCLSQYDYSVAPGGWHSQYGEAVVDVAELIYNGGDKLVHHLDTGGVPVSGMDIGGHYSTIGYAYIAKRVNDEVNKVIYQYRADTEIKTFGVYNL